MDERLKKFAEEYFLEQTDKQAVRKKERKECRLR